MQTTLGRTRWMKPVLLAVLAAVLLVAMFADTTFLSRTAAAKDTPGAFDAANYAKDRFPKLTKLIGAKAVDITKLAPAVEANLAAAGKKYGQNLGAGSFAFPVRASGTVTSVDANFAVVKVAGMPAADVVRIPLGIALNGAPVRDATGTINYGNFNDQTAYQTVADQLKLVMQTQVIAPAKLAAAKGKKLDVVGAFASGGPAHSFIIQPVTITAGG